MPLARVVVVQVGLLPLPAIPYLPAVVAEVFLLLLLPGDVHIIIKATLAHGRHSHIMEAV